MGLPIARRLSLAWDTTGFDVDRSRRALASSLGVGIADSAKALAADVDVLVVVLPGAASERAAFSDAAAPIDALRPGGVIVELTSGDPELTRRLAADAGRRGVGFVSAPMAGDPRSAEEGTLGFFVAGAADAVGRARPILAALSRAEGVHLLGEDPAVAQTMKLVVNGLWFGQAALVAEGMLLATRSGLDPALIHNVLGESAAASALVRDYVPRLLRGDYVESFGIDGVVEELDTLVGVARSLGTPSTVIEETARLHALARDRFGPVAGELLVVKLLEHSAGVDLRARDASGAGPGPEGYETGHSRWPEEAPQAREDD
jgi:3-hydroxyisobutyrate dehydrogenase-like beta-hydroxyacid dehydrogenase